MQLQDDSWNTTKPDQAVYMYTYAKASTKKTVANALYQNIAVWKNANQRTPTRLHSADKIKNGHTHIYIQGCKYTNDQPPRYSATTNETEHMHNFKYVQATCMKYRQVKVKCKTIVKYAKNRDKTWKQWWIENCSTQVIQECPDSTNITCMVSSEQAQTKATWDQMLKCNHYNVYEVQTTKSKFTMKSKCGYQHWCTAVRQSNQGWHNRDETTWTTLIQIKSTR